MARQADKVPFGYEPEPEPAAARGSIWVYDSFEAYAVQRLERVQELADRKNMAKLVLYPLHEQTLRRMGHKDAEPYYRRADALGQLLERVEPRAETLIDRWEGRRKKYTPMDTAFRYLADKYKGPHFVYATLDMANRIAAFDSFEGWIKKLRFFVDDASSSSDSLHPKLEAYAHRWELVHDIPR
ncbi:hypothetical protein [Paenibacillus piri]|uniref:Uncharacterized protein n=1 Tax=Paenibacillus piri TaxID=2547395 RepID=A0A4R5K555_9BACL|nr:hypothetical protein [Paenibacillus piri]TDF87720.1 hypothetical protein E1757_35495 [Paenibacillus piri]